VKYYAQCVERQNCHPTSPHHNMWKKKLATNCIKFLKTAITASLVNTAKQFLKHKTQVFDYCSKQDT